MNAAHPHLLVDDDGPVRTITLNRPQARNAQVPSQWIALARLARETPSATRVVVLRGAGETFSAGLDTALLDPAGLEGETNFLAITATDGAQAASDAIAALQEGFTAWRSCPAIVIAQVQGYAIGAGFQLALAADLRIAAEDAKFAMRETSLGLVPDLAGTSPLVHLVGYSRALDICASGRFVGAQEALGIGLVNAVVPVAELDKAVRRRAIAMMTAPAGAVTALKALLVSAVSAPLEDQIRAERQAQGLRFAALLRGETA